MDVIPPLTDGLTTISEAMLVSTNVPETAPAAYNAGTTYALAATASDLSANLILVYESLQAGNTGHTPASSPLWWRLIGRTYPVYSGAATYALGDHVIDAVAHKIYQSLVAGNIGHALNSGTHWLEVGPTNRWAALDLNRSTGTTSPSPMRYTIAPGIRVDAVGFASMVADSYTVSVKKDGVEVYSYTENLSTRIVLGWLDYFTKRFTYRKASARFDLPLITGAEVTVTFTRSGGDVTVGAIFLNRAINLGETEVDPEDDAQNYSTFTREIDGSASTFIPRRVIPLSRQTSFAEAERTPEIRAVREELRATPAMWVGLRDATNPYFESLVIVGTWKGFKITPGHPDVRCDIDLEEA